MIREDIKTPLWHLVGIRATIPGTRCSPGGFGIAGILTFLSRRRQARVSIALFWPLAVCFALPALAQDPQEIVRRSVQLDQTNWMRMADYTWVGRSLERHFDSHDRVVSLHREAWETIILDGQPFRRMLERDGKSLPPD